MDIMKVNLTKAEGAFDSLISLVCIFVVIHTNTLSHKPNAHYSC